MSIIIRSNLINSIKYVKNIGANSAALADLVFFQDNFIYYYNGFSCIRLPFECSLNFNVRINDFLALLATIKEDDINMQLTDNELLVYTNSSKFVLPVIANDKKVKEIVQLFPKKEIIFQPFTSERDWNMVGKFLNFKGKNTKYYVGGNNITVTNSKILCNWQHDMNLPYFNNDSPVFIDLLQNYSKDITGYVVGDSKMFFNLKAGMIVFGFIVSINMEYLRKIKDKLIKEIGVITFDKRIIDIIKLFAVVDYEKDPIVFLTFSEKNIILEAGNKIGKVEEVIQETPINELIGKTLIMNAAHLEHLIGFFPVVKLFSCGDYFIASNEEDDFLVASVVGVK